MRIYEYSIVTSLILSIFIGYFTYRPVNKNNVNTIAPISRNINPTTTLDTIYYSTEQSTVDKKEGCKPCGKWVASTGFPAKLCNNCGFGSKKDNCVTCGNWVGSTKISAQLCNSCGFGNKKDNCAKCGNWIGSNGVAAQLCNSCGFGNKKENCVKCN